jgi:hypothetical protein
MHYSRILNSNRSTVVAGLMFAACLASCTRKEDEKVLLSDQLSVTSNNSTTGCVENIDIGTYSVEKPVPTVLGTPLKGAPFSVENMKIASKNLYQTSTGISATNLYVRFKPADDNQLKTLLEFANSNDWDLFDYPLDQDVLTEGDYYPQPGIGPEEMPWFYTVIPNLNYTYPSGIRYEILQSLYISDNIELENEALRITNNAIPRDCGSQISALARIPPVDDRPVNAEFPDPPPPVVPNNPGPATKSPAGFIRVWDKQLQTGHGVPGVKVIARRWFKIARAETNNDGYFWCNRTFGNKVNILVKMKGANMEIRHIRSARFWQMWFPVKMSIGKYSGTLNNINYFFIDDDSETSNRHMLWYAGTVMRSFTDYNTQAAAIGIGQAPANMRIMLTTWGQGHSTPMNKKRNNASQAPREWIEYFLAHPTLAVNAQMSNYLYNAKLLPEIDMSLSYGKSGMSSSDAREGIYHELTHAAHFNQVGQKWWNALVYAAISETQRFGIKSVQSPYGDGAMGSTSDYIGLAESWGVSHGAFYGQSDLWAVKCCSNNVRPTI